MAKKKSTKKKTKALSANKTKTNYLPLIVTGVIIVLLIIVYFLVISKPVVKEGDKVTFDYTGKLDDETVFDTSIQKIGLQSKLQKQEYKPLTAILGQGELILGFEDALKGMKEGQTKTIKILPEQAYGLVKEELILKELKRELNATRYSVVDKETFNTVFGEDSTIGRVIEREEIPWALKITKVNATDITLEGLAKLGDKIKLPGAEWESEVKKVTDKEIVIFQNPVIGVSVSFPTAKGLVVGKVINVTQETFDVDTNHPLAGKTLTFEITLRKIENNK